MICLKGFIAEIPPTKVGEKGPLTLTEFSKQRNLYATKTISKKAWKKKFFSIKSAAEISLTQDLCNAAMLQFQSQKS